MFSVDSLYLSGAQPERFGTTPDLSDGCHQRGTGETRSNDHWSRTTSFNLRSKEPPDKSNVVHVEASENALYHGQIHLNLDRWIIRILQRVFSGNHRTFSDYPAKAISSNRNGYLLECGFINRGVSWYSN